jgi:D-alanyl-D-alanine carboxypeptidase
VTNKAWDISVSKTGFINAAGKCLVMKATVAKRDVIIVLLDSFGKYGRVNDAILAKNWIDGMPFNTFQVAKHKVQRVSKRFAKATYGNKKFKNIQWAKYP